jgi:hypothetical protein
MASMDVINGHQEGKKISVCLLLIAINGMPKTALMDGINGWH